MNNSISSIFALGAYILGGSFIILLFLSIYFLKPYKGLFIIMLLIPFTAALAYIAMAHNIGVYLYSNKILSVTRYVDWIITTPLLLYILSQVMIIEGKARTRTIIWLITCDVVMLVTGFISELSHGIAIYIWFMLSGGSYLTMLYIITQNLLSTEELSTNLFLRKIAIQMAWIIIGLWSLYPLVWIVGIHGIGIVSYRTENIAYLILDVLTKVGFASLLLRYLVTAYKLDLITPHANPLH